MSAFYGTCNCLSRIIIHTFILEYSYLYKATEMYQADIVGHFVMFLSIQQVKSDVVVNKCKNYML